MLNYMYERRSIRKFQSQPVEKEKLDQVIQAALLAPTAVNRKPCRFLVVEDKETLEKLSTAKGGGAGFLKEAAAAIVVLVDEGISDVWIEDAAIAAAYIQLEAQALGLNSCWAQLRLRKHADGRWADEYMEELLHLPNTMRAPIIIGIGYGAEEKAAYTEGDLTRQHVCYEKFDVKA